jgi:2-dehydro-3-deoxy-D-gluconate 5-dehydrogenase
VLVLASGLVLTSMAIEFAAGNVQVNAMLPGWFETEMTAPVKTMPAIHDEILLRTRAGRWGQADELMGCGVFSAAGIPLRNRGFGGVDGGYSIQWTTCHLEEKVGKAR